MRVALLMLALVACSTPPLKLDLAVSQSSDKSCNATTCTGVPMQCDAIASIRILDPAQPSAPYISQCQRIPRDAKADLCALAQLDLRQDIPLPEQTLEVQVVIYQADQIPLDPMTHDPICPTEREGLSFDVATGFPTGPIAMQDPSIPSKIDLITPAIGGRGFWHPGDASVVVSLACNDLETLNAPSCKGTDMITATAVVNDFDQAMSVAVMVADKLTVRIGEPKLVPNSTDIDFALTPAESQVLDRTVIKPVPAWGAPITLSFAKTACIEVLEDRAQATATVTCKVIPAGATTIDITGIRLAKESLDNILTGLGTMALPEHGLTIGVVLTYLGVGAPNQIVTATPPTGGQPTIEYIADDRKTIVPGATQTQFSSGLFLSRDAPYGTTFSTQNGQLGAVTAVGGLVDGKVTIVVLQLSKPPNTQ